MEADVGSIEGVSLFRLPLALSLAMTQEKWNAGKGVELVQQDRASMVLWKIQTGLPLPPALEPGT